MNQEIKQIDLDGVNVYLVKTDNGFTLFDTGGHIVTDKQFTDRKAILEKELDNAGCTPENLKLIILTHGDNDHACNALYFKEKYKAQIAMNEHDVGLVQKPNLKLYMNSFQYKAFLYKVVFKLMNKMILQVTKKILNDFEPFTPDILLQDGFNLSGYGLNAKVIHSPGHTYGSIVILFEDGSLIAGDVFVNNQKPSLAPNANDFKVLSESTDKLKSYKINKVYPGHGKPFNYTELKY